MLKDKPTIDKANQYFRNNTSLYVRFFQRYLQYGHKFFLERAISKYYFYHKKYPQYVLDVGCGFGVSATYLIGRISGVKIVAIDPSQTMIDMCLSASHTSVDFSCIKLIDFFSEKPFDLILSHSSFRFWDSPVQELIKVAQLLNEGGLFYLLDLRRDCCGQLLETLILDLIDNDEKEFMRDQFIASYSLEEVNIIVQKTGIMNIEIFPGIPELAQENQVSFFESLAENQYMAKALMDLKKGFKNRRGPESIYHIALYKQ